MRVEGLSWGREEVEVEVEVDSGADRRKSWRKGRHGVPGA